MDADRIDRIAVENEAELAALGLTNDETEAIGYAASLGLRVLMRGFPLADQAKRLALLRGLALVVTAVVRVKEGS